MVEANSDTTTLLLGVLAAASVLQVLVLIAAGIVCYRLCRRAEASLREMEAQTAPLVADARELIVAFEAVLADVRGVTGRVTRQTQRVDAAAGRVRESLAAGVGRAAGVARAARTVLADLFGGRRAPAA